MRRNWLTKDVPLAILDPVHHATSDALRGIKPKQAKRKRRSIPQPAPDAIAELPATYRQDFALLSASKISLSAAILLHWLAFKGDFDETLIALDPNCKLGVGLSDRLRAIAANSTKEEIADLTAELTGVLWERQQT